MRYKIYNGMQKQAGPMAELIASRLYGGAFTEHGGMKGYLEPVMSDKELEKMDTDESSDWAPGVGGYRLQRRMKKTLENDKGKAPHYWSQNWAPAVHALVGATAGAGIGAAVAPDGDKPLGAILGLYGGAAAPLLASALIGGLGAAITPRRSKEEQKAYNNSSTAPEWIIPGLSTYNSWKTFGRAKGNFDEAKEKRESKKKEDKGEKKEASIQKLAYAAIGQGYTPQYQTYDVGPGYMNVQGGVAPTGSTYQPQYAYAGSGYNNGQRYVSYGNVQSAQYAAPRNVGGRNPQPQPQLAPPPQGQPTMRPNSPYMGTNANGVRTVTAGNVPGYQNNAPRNIGGRGTQQRPAMAAPQPPVQRQMRPNSPYMGTTSTGIRSVTAGNAQGYQNKAPRRIAGRGY